MPTQELISLELEKREILGKSGVSLILRRDDDCLTSVKREVTDALLPGKLSKLQVC